jgi:hypothetical protein
MRYVNQTLYDSPAKLEEDIADIKAVLQDEMEQSDD